MKASRHGVLCATGILCFAVIGNGCKGAPGAATSSSGSDTTSSAPVGMSAAPTTDAFKVTVSFPNATQTLNYYLHTQTGAFSSASCQVAPGTTTPNNDIYCYLDVQELDLYINGVSLQFNAPPGMCNYNRVKLYHYWGKQPGNIPSTTVCTVTTDQTVTPATVTAGCTAGSHLTYNGGGFTCDYDYTASQGPNCCEGSYQLLSITNTSSGSSATSTQVKYSGLNSNCLVGPAKDLFPPLAKTGYPPTMYYSAQSSGQNQILNISSPIAKQMASNLYLGNYWNPTSYQRTATVETGTFPPAVTNDLPIALQTAAGYTPSPYYDFGCMDAADDYIARIRVLIRSWDTVANFTATSNPYTDPTTNEPGFNSEYYLHDRSVWNDFSPTVVNAPYPDLYPGMTY